MKLSKIVRIVNMGVAFLVLVFFMSACVSKGKVDKDRATSDTRDKVEVESSREQFIEDETTTKVLEEGPTASVLPNDATTQPPTSTKENTKPTQTTNKTNTTEKQTTTAIHTEDKTTIEETTTEEETTTQTPPTVESFYMTKTEFDITDMSYMSLGFYIKNNPGNIEWVSKDSTVAQIIDDELIGINTGTTTITGTVGENSVTISVNVEPLYEYEEERPQYIFMSSERIYLFMESVDVESEYKESLMTDLEKILDEIEKVTGYSYTKISDNVEHDDTRTKIVIQAIGTDEVYVSTDELVIDVASMDFEQNGIYNIVSELLGMVLLRNSVDVGAAINEGYKEYQQSQVCHIFEYDVIYDASNIHQEQLKVMDELTVDNIVDKLLYPENNTLSYYFVRYIAENYGNDKIKKLADAITIKAVELYESVLAGQASLFTEEEILHIIEENTSLEIMDDFYDYIISIREMESL